MIVAGTSAIMAILSDEPDRPRFDLAISEDGEILVSVAAAVEFIVVTLRGDEQLYRAAIDFLSEPYVHLVPFDEAQMWAAAEAFRRYGQGRSPARLNFGDTFSYALASTRGLPLLFKGDDFIQADIVPAALPGS